MSLNDLHVAMSYLKQVTVSLCNGGTKGNKDKIQKLEVSHTV
jgi:hypothetical protein